MFNSPSSGIASIDHWTPIRSAPRIRRGSASKVERPPQERAAAPELVEALRQASPALADVSTDQQGSAPQLRIEINRDAAARFGIQPQAIDDTLDDAFGQRQVGQYFTQTNTCTIALLPGHSCSISVRFAPTIVGTITGSLQINDNASNTPQVVSLSGRGIR